MKRKPESITVHLRRAARRIDKAANFVCDGMIKLHCTRVLALSRGRTRDIRKLFFSDPIVLEDRAFRPITSQTWKTSTLFRLPMRRETSASALWLARRSREILCQGGVLVVYWHTDSNSYLSSSTAKPRRFNASAMKRRPGLRSMWTTTFRESAMFLLMAR